MELCLRIESIFFCSMIMSLFKTLFSDSRNLILSLSNNTFSFSLFEPPGFFFFIVFFNDVISFLKLKISLNKWDFDATILISNLSSNDLMWVFKSSIDVLELQLYIVVVMLDVLNWGGWLSKSLLSEISDQISPSSLGVRF